MNRIQQYIDRYHAGKILAAELSAYANRDDVLVLALPRGGVPVAHEIAIALAAPLDVFIVRKLGLPWHEELAMGAIAMGGTVVFNQDVLNQTNISQTEINQVIKAEEEELKRREKKYRGSKPFPALAGKTIILVDDGIATGATMRAAILSLRKYNPDKIIMAVPVGANSTIEEMSALADEIVCPLRPEYFSAVGKWYQNFSQTEDEEVYSLLKH